MGRFIVNHIIMSMSTLSVGLHCSEQDPIYLSIDCRAKRLIFTGVCIVKFRNWIPCVFHVYVQYLFLYCMVHVIFHIQKIRIHNSHVLRSSPNNFDAEISCQAVCTSRYHLGGGTWNPSGFHRCVCVCVGKT